MLLITQRLTTLENPTLAVLETQCSNILIPIMEFFKKKIETLGNVCCKRFVLMVQNIQKKL